MYKVFFNEYLLVFESEIKNSSKYNINQGVEIQTVHSFFSLLSSLEKGKCVVEPEINCLVAEEFWTEMNDYLTRIPAAGGVVTNRKSELLFIKRMGRWDLPKGKIEKNESARDAALREVGEECGIGDLKILRPLPPTRHLYRSSYIKEPDNWVLKETFWFEMLYGGDGAVSPQREEDIEDVRWFARDKLATVYSSIYSNLKDLLAYYLA